MSFDLSNLVRCTETNQEGFRCRLSPTHDGPHAWDRCPWTDRRGRGCILPPEHPGDHELFWYDLPVEVGATHRMTYGGSRRTSTMTADRAAANARAHGWVERSRSFELGWLWRTAPVAQLLGSIATPQGSTTVIYEYRGPEVSGD